LYTIKEVVEEVEEVEGLSRKTEDRSKKDYGMLD